MTLWIWFVGTATMLPFWVFLSLLFFATTNSFLLFVPVIVIPQASFAMLQRTFLKHFYILLIIFEFNSSASFNLWAIFFWFLLLTCIFWFFSSSFWCSYFFRINMTQFFQWFDTLNNFFNKSLKKNTCSCKKMHLSYKIVKNFLSAN